MNISFRSVFSDAWSSVFLNKKSFFLVFLFQFIPFLVLYVVVLVASFIGYYLSPKYTDYILDHFNNLPWLLTPAFILLIILLIGITFQLICSYLSNRGLAYIYQKKSFTFRSLLREWRGMWSWAGTGLAVITHFIGLIVLSLLLALGCLYINKNLVVVPVLLGIFCSVFFIIFLSLTTPVYFFEGKKYFQATQRSWEIVHGKWWRTFAYLFVIVAGTILSSLLFGLVETVLGFLAHYIPASLANNEIFDVFLGIGYYAYNIIQSAFNIVVQIIAISFSFSLYFAYQKKSDPTPAKKKIVRKRK